MSDPFLDAMAKDKSEAETKTVTKSIMFTRLQDAKEFVSAARESRQFHRVRSVEDFSPRIMTEVTVGSTSKELGILHEMAKRYFGEVVSA